MPLRIIHRQGVKIRVGAVIHAVAYAADAHIIGAFLQSLDDILLVGNTRLYLPFGTAVFTVLHDIFLAAALPVDDNRVMTDLRRQGTRLGTLTGGNLDIIDTRSYLIHRGIPVGVLPDKEQPQRTCAVGRELEGDVFPFVHSIHPVVLALDIRIQIIGKHDRRSALHCQHRSGTYTGGHHGIRSTYTAEIERTVILTLRQHEITVHILDIRGYRKPRIHSSVRRDIRGLVTVAVRRFAYHPLVLQLGSIPGIQHPMRQLLRLFVLKTHRIRYRYG